MLMRLALIGDWGRVRAANVQNAGRLCEGWGGVSAADAHDAGRVWAVGVKSKRSMWLRLADWVKSVRLMLMMLPGWGVGAESV